MAIAICTYFIYQNIRERVKVIDVMEGRYFSCKSVVSLVEREDTITEMACAFRHFLDMMKLWGGKQVVDIQVGMSPKLRLVEHANLQPSAA